MDDMNILERLLVPHSAIIGQIAANLTILQILSGVFLLNDIRKKGSSNGFPSIPFIGGLALTLLSLRYGAMLRDDAMIKVNLFGFAINVIYTCVFYFYTPGSKKNQIWRQIGLAGLFCIGCLVYAEYEDPHLVEERFGLLVTVILMVLVGSPFLSIGEVIRTKCTKSLPFPLILSGTIVSISWLLYGISIRNRVIIGQNFILTGMSLIQLSLFFIYPNEPATKSKKQKPKKDN